jgi:hypothetical protein
MKSLKQILTVGLVAVSLSSFVHAKNQEEQNNRNSHSQEYEHSKQKEIPKGLQKKKELPPGWQKKLVVGERFDSYLLQNSMIVHNPKYYSKDMENGTKMKVYQIENKIIKVMAATNIIMDVLEVE